MSSCSQKVRLLLEEKKLEWIGKHLDLRKGETRTKEYINKLNKNPFMYYSGVSIYLFRSIPYHTSTFCTFEYIKNIKIIKK